MPAIKKSFNCLLFILFLLAGCTAPATLPQSDYLWEEFKKNPAAHSIIPDNSYAGYYQGEKELPSFKMEAAKNVKKFGARGDGIQDDTKAIQAALDKGGSIYLPEGKYLLSSRLILGVSGLHLSGDGPGKTILLFTKPLSKIEGKFLTNEKKSYFAWNGGLVHIGPGEDFSGGQIQEDKKQGWGIGKRLATVKKPALRGDEIIEVSDSDKIAAQQWIFITWEKRVNKKTLDALAGFPPNINFSWETMGKAWYNRRLPWPVQVKAVEGKKITLEQPLRMDISSWDKVMIHAPGSFITDVGIENLEIQMNGGGGSEHLQETGFNGIFIHKAFNSWAKNIVIKDADSGVLLDSAKNISIFGVVLDGRRKYHHGFFTKSTHDSLISDFTINAPMIHGINADIFGTGNVWSRGLMKYGTFDMHRGMQFDLIRTQIDINNDGKSGGDLDAGPMQGRRVVHWNIKLRGKNDLVNQPELMPEGALVGIQSDGAGFVKEPAPENLYEAQRARRLGK